MATRKQLMTAFGSLVLAMFLAVSTHGSGMPLHTNHLTFSGAVRLPGVTLGAGTYIFERLDAINPDVVVVRSRDRAKVYYMAMTNRTPRPSGLASDRLVTFGETRRGDAPPILAWYPEDEQVGHQFFYGTR